MKKAILYVLALFLISHVAYSQAAFKLEKSSSKLSVLGTSTLHDWESDVEDYSASATQENNQILNIRFSAKVESIKSGKSAMDKNTYRAMMSDKHPNVTFRSSKLNISGQVVSGTGQLTIAGKTRTIPVNFKYEKWTEGSFQVTGSVNLKMTDYGVEPPTAMMGAISTGDEITVEFEFVMNN